MIPVIASNMPFCITKLGYYTTSENEARDHLKEAV